MHSTEMKDFYALLKSTARFYRRELSNEDGEVYWKVLKNQAMGHIKFAIDQHMGTPEKGDFMPTPARIVKLIRDMDKFQEAKNNIMFPCGFHTYAGGGECRNQGEIHIVNSDPAKYLCFEHYEQCRKKTPIDLKREEIMKTIPKYISKDDAKRNLEMVVSRSMVR